MRKVYLLHQQGYDDVAGSEHLQGWRSAVVFVLHQPLRWFR